MIDFTKLTAQEIRNLLLEKGVRPEVVNSTRGKANLVELYYNVVNEDQVADFSSVEINEEPVLENETEVVNKIPEIGSLEWEEYVISLLRDKEYEERNGKKYPKSIGLRRVAQMLLGPITYSGPDNVMFNGPNVTVTYKVRILWTHGLNLPRWMPENDLMQMNIPERVFLEVADCSKENTPSPYNLHPSATASSRAEGRVFRKALQLTVLTAEEMSMTSDIQPEVSLETESITSHQLIVIRALAERLGIDLSKALKHYNMPVEVEKLSRAQGAELKVLLNKYQTNIEASLEIPQEIKL